MVLLTIANAKTPKGEKAGYLTGILYLHPHELEGKNVCPYATAGCASACLNTAGRGRTRPVQDARKRKTRWFHRDRASFIAQLSDDIESLIRRAKRRGLKPIVRLNGTSDIAWNKVAKDLIESYPNVIFYDYTKAPHRSGWMLPNYHVTYSFSEKTSPDMFARAVANGNTAVVFRGELPDTFRGLPVISGDETDLRFLDPKAGHIIGLKAKGEAKKDTSGFVVDA